MSLVDDLRTLTAAGNNEYSAGDNTFWSDSQLQATLNRNRRLMDFQPLEWYPRTFGGGSVEYKRAFIGSNWQIEPNAGTVQDGQGGTVTGWTLDGDGWMNFAADTRGSALYYSGYVYNIKAAAAEVCTAWASALKTQVDVTSDDQSLKLSQKRTSLLDMAREFRKGAPLSTGALTRGDAQ
jgi:hypothetical protein